MEDLFKVEPWKNAESSKFCNELECANSHCWPAQIGVSECPGCKNGTLLVRAALCPVCNEPARVLRVHMHWTASGHYGAACRDKSAPEEIARIIEVKL